MTTADLWPAEPAYLVEAARFDPKEARIAGGAGGGRWTRIGKSGFTYDGPPGGGGHVRAIMSVADTIAQEPGGADTAHALRESAKAMYRRDMKTAHVHLDNAAYLDSVSG